MRLLAFSLLLSGSAFGGGRHEPKAAVGVYVIYEHLSSGRALLQSDVQSILLPLGFSIQWRDMKTAGREAWVDLALLRFQGHCDLFRASGIAFVPGALGETHVSDGRIQPFAEIDCDRIGNLLQPDLAAVREPDRERLFQRALARVVAHELYHIFAKTPVHEPTGVGKAEFTASDLLSNRFQFHPAQASVLLKSSSDDALQISLNQP